MIKIAKRTASPLLFLVFVKLPWKFIGKICGTKVTALRAM
jgi:hypothetical protein